MAFLFDEWLFETLFVQGQGVEQYGQAEEETESRKVGCSSTKSETHQRV